MVSGVLTVIFFVSVGCGFAVGLLHLSIKGGR